VSKGPTFLQAFLLTICGAALALFGCLGALSGMGRDNPSALAQLGGLGFVAGLLMLAVGLALLAYVTIRGIVRLVSGPPAPPPDDDPPSTPYGGGPSGSNDPPA